MELRIRIATEEDVDAIVGIRTGSKAASTPELLEDYDHDIPLLTRRWRSYLLEGSRAQKAIGDGFVFLAELDRRAVGFIAYHHTRRHDTDAELESLYVLKEAQGKGVGTELLRIIAVPLVQEGSKTLCVGYDPHNPYKRFYLKHGAVELNPHWAIWPDVRVLVEGNLRANP